MKTYFYFPLAVLSLFLLSSCFEDRDDSRCVAGDNEIKDFIYKGLNTFYLYKGDQPALSNNRFSNQSQLDNYLGRFGTPESFFDNLIVPQDRFSILVPDYRVLESNFNGITLNNGMEFGLVQLPATGKVIGYVRYVLPNSSASRKGIERGMIFDRVDGNSLTPDNFRNLLSPQTYTIGLAKLDENGMLTALEREITLTKEEYTENPIFKDTVVNVQNTTIGYLMYNSFTGVFDDELNAVFGRFQGAGLDELVIDLRYNGGGSVESSVDLASMITGQFNGELFSRQVYNSNFEDREQTFNNEVRSGGAINSLNLDRVYILTTRSTASASELLINGLRPYITVRQIGTATTGKFQGSITVYDSPDFSRDNINLCHTYAMQPLIFKSVNANGFTDYTNGLEPSEFLPESLRNLGELGKPSEPLFAKAIQLITGSGLFPQTNPLPFQNLGESGMDQPNFQRMYSDEKLEVK